MVLFIILTPLFFVFIDVHTKPERKNPFRLKKQNEKRKKKKNWSFDWHLCCVCGIFSCSRVLSNRRWLCILWFIIELAYCVSSRFIYGCMFAADELFVSLGQRFCKIIPGHILLLHIHTIDHKFAWTNKKPLMSKINNKILFSQISVRMDHRNASRFVRHDGFSAFEIQKKKIERRFSRSLSWN